jgi:hypothetical protein
LRRRLRSDTRTRLSADFELATYQILLASFTMHTKAKPERARHPRPKIVPVFDPFCQFA